MSEIMLVPFLWILESETMMDDDDNKFWRRVIVQQCRRKANMKMH